jgi:hypothetical protein
VASLLPGIAVIVAGLAWPQPLKLTLTSIRAAGGYLSVDQVTATVRNASGRALQPRFNVYDKLQSSFWIVESGPKTLAPGQSGWYVLDAPNRTSQPSALRPFRFQAVTGSPETFSSIRVYPERFTTAVEQMGPHLVRVGVKDLEGAAEHIPGLLLRLEISGGTTLYAKSGADGTATFIVVHATMVRAFMQRGPTSAIQGYSQWVNVR